MSINSNRMAELIRIMAQGKKEHPVASQNYIDTMPFTEIYVSNDEVQTYVKNIDNMFTESTINDLISECKDKTIEAIINPLGLGRIVALYDKVGGNVDTINNVRHGIWATEEEKRKYENREAYSPKEYHGAPGYREKNRKIGEQKKAGRAVDAYTGELLDSSSPTDLDHVISAFEIHNDRARVLAEVDGPTIANKDSNLQPTNPTANRSKKQKSMSEFIGYIDKQKEKLQTQIENLMNKDQLNENQAAELEKLQKKLDALNSIDSNLTQKCDEYARKEYNKTLNTQYYTSKKFILNTAKTSAYEGLKMGVQQAFGLLLYDLTNALFDEIVNMWHNGIIHDNDGWIHSLKTRFKRIGEKVITNWKNVVIAFRDGAFSGFLSNIITVFINIFATTAKNIVRIIREGTMVLVRTAKAVLFPEKNMTPREIWDNALKILVTGAITVGGVALQEAISKVMLSIPFSNLLITICVGLVTGVSSAIALYALDKLDPFGAKDEKRRYAFYNKLQEDEKHLLEFQEKMYTKYMTGTNAIQE